MKIRGKLLTLILIPLLAVSTAAVWGFRDQSIKTEQAEEAVELAEASAAVHRVVLGLADERLALYADRTPAEIDELQAVTDAAIADAGLATDAVDSARAETDRVAAAAGYTSAIAGLLDDAGEVVYESEQLLTNIAAHSTYLMLEARESAWFDYIEASELIADGAAEVPLVPVASSLAESVSLAGTSANFIDQQFAVELKTASDSAAEQNMSNLAFLATNQLAAGTVGVASSDIVTGLESARAEWEIALLAADDHLIEETQILLDDANAVRSLFSLLGVVGMVVLAGLVFVIYRSITQPLENLVTRARSVAQDELPELVRTLRSEENFDDLPEPVLIPVSNNDEIGELVEAFNEVQFTAHELATEQALGRRNVAEMFVNLGRRNQQLLQRILGMLTDLERDEEDPETLRDLFVLDNVVTRMRRNAESLLVLAGGQTPRQWSQPVSLEDTVRSALSEVEGYERIDIAALAEVRLPGNVVADVAHLLAELIENAVSFSDPATQVLIGGHFEDNGYLITIFDQGIGMTEEELEENNRRIIDPPPLDQAPTRFLGLFVVGRLADRHDIRVRLAKAPGRGIMARVLLPNTTLIVDEGVDVTPSESAFGGDDLAVVEAAEAGMLSAGLPVRSVSSEFDDVRHVDDLETVEAVADSSEFEPFDEIGEIGEIGEFAEAAPLAAEMEDLDDVLAGVGTDEVPEPVDVLEALPTRHAGATLEPEPEPEPEPVSELPQRRRSNDDELPTRVKGGALDEEGEAPAEQAAPKQVETVGEAAAGSFASMMSAFSSGVNKGLEDTAFDSIDEGNES